MMFLGIYKDTEGKRQEKLYFNYSLWFADTFSPVTEEIKMILFKISGKTYTEKKEHLKNLAIDFQSYDEGGLSYLELAEINCFFEKNAKRYGLIKEFKENGII